MLRVIPFLVALHIKSEMEYRGAFLLDRIAQIISYGSAYAAIWILVQKFQALDGWTWPELALLLSFQLLAYALGASFSFTQMREMENLIRRGQFDALLVKPFSPWAYLVFSEYNIGYLGHIVLAVGLMVWSLAHVEIDWTTGALLYFAASLVSATLLVAAIITMIGASALVIVRSRYLYTIFFGLHELVRYPITIFPAAIQWLLVTVTPLAFINYVPVSHLLGRDIAVIGTIGGAFAPLIGPLAVLVAMAHWRFCVRRYQGAGG